MKEPRPERLFETGELGAHGWLLDAIGNLAQRRCNPASFGHEKKQLEVMHVQHAGSVNHSLTKSILTEAISINGSR